MLKMLAKKGKSNKGFTLIELIVVIAIIAILALLLVPRFAGFTEDAKIANDRNACETIERAFQTLFANGSLRITGAVVIDIDDTKPNGAWTLTSGSFNDFNNVAISTIGPIETAVENLTGEIGVQAATHTTGFHIVVDTDGNVTVTVS